MPQDSIAPAVPKSGEAVLAQKARVAVVAKLTCANGLAILAALAPPLLVALMTGAGPIAVALAPGGAIACAMAIYGKLAEAEDPRQGEALVSIAASFIAATLLAAPAFAALGMSPVDAMFESVSAITTTGLSLASEPDDWPYAAHFLRAWLQWVGGFAFVSAALALVVGQGVIAKRLGAAGGVRDDRAASTRSRARALLLTYVVLTVVSVAMIGVSHPDPLSGGLVALSAISTGGFSPYSDNLASAGFLTQATAIASCLMGAISLGVWWLVLREGPLKMVGDGELRLFAMVLIGGVAAIALVEWRSGGAALWPSVFTAISAQSTAGFSVNDVSSFAPGSLIILIGMMVIGGCVGATSGGIKAFRLGFFLAALRLMLARARISASAATYLRVFGRKTSPGEGTDVMGLMAIYILAAAALWIVLVLSGAAALPALFDTVSALSTVGLSIGAITADLPDAAKAAATLAMLLGRLEFLALIVFLTPKTWIKD